MATEKPFIFVCGADDFLVQRAGKARYDALAAEITDEFSRETISGYVGNVGEVEEAINRFREAVQTVSMFGGRRLVWFKDLSFLADTVTGRAESTLKLVEDLQAILAANDPTQVAILITAAPVDRRRAFPKWCEKTGDFELCGGDGDRAGEALAGVVLQEAKGLGVRFGEGALELLLARVGANTRLLIEEVNKLATAAGDRAVIEEADVAELTPNVAEGDFFEVPDLFFKGDLRGTLAALERHFFAGGDSRPIIASLQNRNRLLLQVKAVTTAGLATVSNRGLNGLDRAKAELGRHFVGAEEKSSYNLFTQNPWYLGKLASGPLPSLARLIDNQQEFVSAFEELIRRPDEQADVMREMVVRCLAK
ncbi:DNA polymerase III subunit delta [Nibricoccus sp. IMCC34717]|uniref:DNA polymerase III subunit delta n=1 Tax=Nibricoccus sp. IMCC34717 TaxID=3034021 RepID=UPI00384DCBE0